MFFVFRRYFNFLFTDCLQLIGIRRLEFFPFLHLRVSIVRGILINRVHSISHLWRLFSAASFHLGPDLVYPAGLSKIASTSVACSRLWRLGGNWTYLVAFCIWYHAKTHCGAPPKTATRILLVVGRTGPKTLRLVRETGVLEWHPLYCNRLIRLET